MPPTNTEQTFPDKPSISEPLTLPSTMVSLLTAAITDARSLDQTGYLPNFDNWHRTSIGDYCEVCLAGSLIAGRLKNPPSLSLDCNSFSLDTNDKLRAVDAMRCGEWRQACVFLYDIDPDEAFSASLDALPIPRARSFNGWDEFDLHLRSLEALMPSLAEFDRIAAAAKANKND